MATFDGYDLGIIEEMTTEPEPAGWQKNSYPGIRGLELLAMGSRGLVTHCHGSIAGIDPVDLSSIKQAFGGYVLSQVPCALVDADGTIWLNVVMVAFRPVGRRYLLGYAGEAGVAQRYEAEFLHPSS